MPRTHVPISDRENLAHCTDALHGRRRKTSVGHGPAITRSDLARFFRGYDPDGAQWRSDWQSVRERHAVGLTLHRIGWGLERMVGGRKEDARSEQGVLVPTASERGNELKGQ